MTIKVHSTRYLGCAAVLVTAIYFSTRHLVPSHFPGPVHQSASHAQYLRDEVLFITAVYGTYEKSLKEPTKQSIPARFVAFTDRDDLSSSPGWEVFVVKDPLVFQLNSTISGRNDLRNNRHPFNMAKFFKMQFHRLEVVRGHRIAVWLDATVLIKNVSTATAVKDMVVKDRRNVILFEHERSGILANEAGASVFDRYASTHWGCCDQPFQNVTDQYIHYVSHGFREKWWQRDYDAPLGITNRSQYGLWVTCFVIFDMHNPVSATFLDAWWHENVKYTTQDQVSFPYLAWKLKVYPFTLPIDGYIEGTYAHNNLFVKMGHGNR